MATIECDVVIAGGGLSGGLIALALAREHPELNVMLIEKQELVGGNHIWSFFANDVDPAHRWLTAPLVTYGWSGHDVRFPAHSRTLKGLYYSAESERLDWLVRRNLRADRLLTGRKILACSPRSAILDDGTRIEAQAVIDTRGPADLNTLECGWQKFVGQVLEVDEPHGMKHPIIMDATVTQHDGYRFIYCLPFSPNRLFVEDTYYSDGSDLDEMTLRARIAEWTQRAGLKGARVVREEKGVLPVVIGGDFERYWTSGGARVPKAGVRGGFFHPLTSYSLPDAARTAIAIANGRDFGAQALHDRLKAMADAHWQSGKFYRTLGRMLFQAGEPDQRYRIFERFYTLSESLIGRFYAGRTSASDKLRILSGKPPVPITGAIRAIGSGKR